MADINAKLLRDFNDDAAPQHKVKGQNAFEFSEGSNGALHTKIVDTNGTPLSSMPVVDSDVKAELEDIKQQQAQILQRLDSTFNTQLTGSNVPQMLAAYGYETTVYQHSGAVAAQSSVTVLEVRGFECQLESLTLGTNDPTVALDILPIQNDGTNPSMYVIADSDGSAIRALSISNLKIYSNGENDFFKNQIFDEAAGRYAMVMKRPLKLGNGLIIRVRNFSAAEKNISLSITIYKKHRR